MAINSMEVACDKLSPKSKASSKYLKPGTLPGSQLVKIDFATEGSICSIAFKHGKYKKNVEYKSPYLIGDSAQLLSRVTEKRVMHKKGSTIAPSFPPATNIYKANSDKFKALKRDKKTRKSVLTIPNAPAPAPQLCTVSDMNDSEYFNRNDDNRIKTKKRSTPAAHTRKSRRVRGKDLEFYDRDAKYCSQMNIKLDCSSTEILNEVNVGEKMSKSNIGSKARARENVNPHDVWTVLRNINRFQFRPSPPLSEESFISPKKLRGRKRRINKKDMRVFETCCTEEYAYISSYEVDSKSPCSFMSQVCSMDTVIEQQKLFNTVCEKLEKKPTKGKKDLTTLYSSTLSNKHVPRNKTIPTKFDNIKKLSNGNQKNKDDKVYGGPSFVACSNKKDNKKMSESNTCYQSFDSKIIKNNYVRDGPQACQDNKLIYLGTSEGGARKDNNQTRNERRDKSPTVHAEESNPPINGITKVVLCKGQNVVSSNRTPSPKRKPYQTNTMNIQPKLTSTEIRRQLIKHKFPIVVLGKDQLSSTIEVVDEDPLQFNGLDEQVWPFMLNWYGTEPTDAKKTKLSENNEFTNKSKLDVTKYMESKSKIGPKQSRLKDNKAIHELKFNKVKIGQKIPDIFNRSQEQVQSTPIRQFRDIMIKLLYKNSPVLSLIHGSHSSDTAKDQSRCISNIAKVNICTDTSFDREEVNSKKAVGTSMKSKPSPSTQKRPWAKAKWASDFIDNVIRKIKTGAYYTHENKVHNQINDHEPKQVDIQTDLNCHLRDEKCLTIPGFDNVQPAVEIKSMNMNEIYVKHCVTNIVVHFDVTTPTVPKANGTKSSALIPVNVTEPHTKIFRCQTSILNAMLPAELCSLLPIMLRSIAESREQVPHLPIPLETPTYLSTISEVSQCDIPKDVHLTRNPMLHIMTMSQELWQLANGSYKNFDKMHPKLHIVRNTSRLIKYGMQFVQELMFDITSAPLFNQMIVNPIMPLIQNPITLNTQRSMDKPSGISKEILNTCTVLQPYPVSERRNIALHEPYSLMSMFKNIFGFVNYNGAACLSIKNSNYDSIVTISSTMRQPLKVRNILTLSVDGFKIDFTLNGCSNNSVTNNKITFFTNTLNNTSEEPTKCVDCVEISSPKICEKEMVKTVVSVNNNKVRRKGFVKLYKKCKSTSNICGEKVTPLNKIANLDDFFQALGSGKILSTAFDSRSGEKIMSSIQEMKNWTAELNPRQALLVLLLTNKKDTSNLVRFRQVLLQGIAVNRITKAHELDMEIEVIERENLNRLSQYEGISYLPASIENQDNLFEELCWIAKTTASDYQRSFDESSEKLLKSLLEKRKKLNPSYLRVMARYVGLGLLKSPGKK